jgi:glycosyltransferase involved in cell wall biosynthesis
MRILLASGHRYPANSNRSIGLKASPNPSRAPQIVHDLLAKGLGELGHTVFYKLDGGQSESLPPGVFPVPDTLPEVDICHNIESSKHPWVTTHHGFYGDAGPRPTRHSIFVSRALARAHNCNRFVWNGIDPLHFTCSFEKEDYFLFLAAMQGPTHKDKYHQKGLEVALELCKKTGIRLIVAGTAIDPAVIDLINRMCVEAGAEYVGDVRGEEKARLLSGARGLLFPTQIIEGFGLAMVEALISGTPVICSNHGACPELIPHDVGFVCATEADYLDALERIGTISPKRCREVAMVRYHYRRMVAAYLDEYRREIAFQKSSKHA